MCAAQCSAVLLLTLAVCASVIETYALSQSGDQSDVCHTAQTYASSMHSLMGLCAGVSSTESGEFSTSISNDSYYSANNNRILDQCIILAVEILKPCVQGGFMDASCSRNSFIKV